jgi:hypothetical protein
MRRLGSKQTSQQRQQQQQWQDQPVVVHVSSSSVSPQGGYRAVSGDDEQQQQQQHGAEAEGLSDKGPVLDPQHMSGLQRFKATLRLWPYMVPLFVVYFAEVRSGTAVCRCSTLRATVFQPCEQLYVEAAPNPNFALAARLKPTSQGASMFPDSLSCWPALSCLLCSTPCRAAPGLLSVSCALDCL